MAGQVPGIVILALGAGALGGADALRVLLGFAGQSPLVDIAICVFVVGMVTAQLLGAMVLVRFVRKTRTGAGAVHGGAGASRAGPGGGADPLAHMSLLVSLAVTFVVTACLLFTSGALVDFAGKGPTIAVLAIGAVAAAVLPRTMSLLHVVRRADYADGAVPAARGATQHIAAATAQTVRLTVLPLVVVGLMAPALAALGGPDALSRLFPGFPRRSPLANFLVIVVVTPAAVVGTTLLARISHWSHNAAVAHMWCFRKLTCVTSLAVVSFNVAYLLASFTGSDAGKHACSV